MRVPKQLAGLRWGAGVTAGVVTVALVNAVAIAIGFLAKALQGPVDEPVFDRVDRAGNTDWTDVLETLTQMGNVRQTQLLAAALALLFAIWFATQGWRWWIPVALFPAAWWIARLCQLTIAAIVDRDRDLVSLVGTKIGAYPSGGCMRIILISGTAVVLASYYGALSKRATQWLLGIPLVLGLAEAYFRTRLNQHWFTDVVAGVLYGWLMLWALARTLKAFDPDPAAAGVARRRAHDDDVAEVDEVDAPA